MKFNILQLCFLAVLGFVSCTEKDPTPAPTIPVAKGVYVLSEGTYGQSNSKLGLYNIASSSFLGDFFVQQNPSQSAGLGANASDMLIYGGKLYAVMNMEDNVTVLNATTGTFIARIPFTQNAAIRGPRYVLAVGNHVMVSSYGGTVNAIDTSSLTITKTIVVGSNPEQLVYDGSKVFVANSGGLNFPNYDSTVSVINPVTMTEERKIVVGKNPYALAVDNSGNLFVSCLGNYSTIPAKLVKVSTLTNSVTFSADTAVGNIRFAGANKLLATGGYLGTAKVRWLRTDNFSATNFVTDNTTIMNPYGIDIDVQNGDVYVTDAKNYSTPGEVFCFNSSGVKKFSFSTTPGINPNKVAFAR